MRVYNVQEIANILKVSTYTVKNYIKDGLIRTITGEKGRAIRVSEKELQRFIEGE